MNYLLGYENFKKILSETENPSYKDEVKILE
jgi:hypothetical protein